MLPPAKVPAPLLLRDSIGIQDSLLNACHEASIGRGEALSILGLLRGPKYALPAARERRWPVGLSLGHLAGSSKALASNTGVSPWMLSCTGLC
eukprot:9538806-Lingulodinium_polyedra.AAC.1